ncbi:potassium channel family protein [Actinocorallia lasiicapitis]
MHVEGRGRRFHAWSKAGAAIVLITGLYFAVPLKSTAPDGPFLLRMAGLFAGLALLTLVVREQVRRALGPGRILAEQVAILFTLVDLVVVVFATLYYVIDDQFTGLVTRLDALYFTVVTLCTVGFGDIAPSGQGARALVTLQMLFDLIILTTALSLVVTRIRPPRSRP